MERQLVDDLKAICQLQHQQFNLVVSGLEINGKPFCKDSINWNIEQDSAKASIKIGLNLEKLLLKGEINPTKLSKSYDRFTLVPDFQSCYMTRLYHIRLTVHLSNGTYSNIKVPVRIQKVL